MITIGQFIEMVKQLFTIFQDFFNAIFKKEEDGETDPNGEVLE